jgi:3-deoxy-D-manno-octulosonic-acid transferase
MQLLLLPQPHNSSTLKVLYFIFVRLLRIGIWIAALWNGKAATWIKGRANLFENLEKSFKNTEPTIWMHCASAGEFEQGKPVLQSLKAQFPAYPVVVSFFSPSGYASGKKFSGADHIVYLPLDTSGNAQKFIEIINPALVVFVKYDYWYHHLKTVAHKKIPLLMVSAIFREKGIFFKWYGGLHREMLSFFTQIFVQDDYSKELLSNIGIRHVAVSGDTRFDRVSTIASKAEGLSEIEDFIQGKKVLIAGSTWPDDERLIHDAAKHLPELKIIIAPHEVHKEHIEQLQNLFPKAALYSKLHEKKESGVLIIDNIGMLSKLYRYATVTYIGGGFNKSGIHNTLEAAVWGKPVVIGPNYEKFKEAKELIACGGAFSIHSAKSLISVLQAILNNKEYLDKSSAAARDYVSANTGATQQILKYIQENRLLTTP